MKYVLLSQGVKIYETADRDIGYAMAEESNKSWLEHKQRCLDEGEPYADNEIEIVEEP